MTTFKKIVVSCDAWDHEFIGYTDGRTYSGWEAPYFTRETLLAIAAIIAEDGGETENDIRYNEKRGTFELYDNGELLTYSTPETFECDGETIVVYDLLHGWSWSNDEEVL